MQGRLFDGTFWSVSHEALYRTVVFERTAASAAALDRVEFEAAALEAALRPIDRGRSAALVDLRRAPIDPRVNAEAFRARQQRAFAGFRRYAFVVRTAVGKLQVSRLSREGAENAGVFFDVDEARLFCREGLGCRP